MPTFAIVLIIILALTTITFGILFWCKRVPLNKNIEKKNEEIQKKNDILVENNNQLVLEQDRLKRNLQINEQDLILIKNEKALVLGNLDELKNLQRAQEENLKQFALNSFENYCELLEKDLEKKEKEYEAAAAQLSSAYDLAQDKLLHELEEERALLSKVRATRAAAIEAQKREQEIKEKLSFYCVQPTQAELADIKKLEAIKPQLNNPRILSMLIWSTYFQKPMTSLCNHVLGITAVCGIYKITNQINNMCYIGQSVNIQDRWKQHAKCGLGIDTPIGNKLYKAMITDGLWNFSFELLETCSKEQLNEKEKFYIDLYSAKDYGYNTTAGNN